MRHFLSIAWGLAWVTAVAAANAPKPKLDTRRGDALFANYFRSETGKLAASCLADIKTLEDWTSRREAYRQQLFEMLGLDPLPSELR